MKEFGSYLLAAVQAPVILMSQNRQGVKDRLDAAHDYEVNLKAELEILSLLEMIDELREAKWQTQLLKERGVAAGKYPTSIK